MNAKNKGAVSSSAKIYWENLLSDDIKLLDLPNRNLKVNDTASKGVLLGTYFSEQLSGYLKSNTSSSNELTTFAISALAILFHRYTNQNDIAFGVLLDQNLSLFRNTIEAEFNFNRVNKDT
ncbi:MAG TPA: hypothetical protein DCM40_21625, partial [Maribacter sp.]|nr:hypothetical protein [Maribacter sp.]